MTESEVKMYYLDMAIYINSLPKETQILIHICLFIILMLSFLLCCLVDTKEKKKKVVVFCRFML